jgi:hypothetical protein
MNIRAVSLVVLVLAVGVGRADETYKSAAGKYSAVLPGKPKESTQEVDTPAGKLTMYVAAFEVKKDLGLLVIHHDYPEAIVKDKPQSVLGRVRDGSMGQDGKLLEDKEIDLNGVPGREYLLSKGDDHFYRARIFLDGPRLYQVVVSGAKKDDVNLPFASKFLESFTISK